MMPADLTEKFNTPLSPEEEKQFQAWAKQAHRERDSFDYDLRGAWKADAKAASNGHLPDTWKKPNHPTFSVESQYSGDKSGVVGGQWIKKGNKWAFVASDDNLTMFGRSALQAYFRNREPDSELTLPLSREERLYGAQPQ